MVVLVDLCKFLVLLLNKLLGIQAVTGKLWYFLHIIMESTQTAGTLVLVVVHVMSPLMKEQPHTVAKMEVVMHNTGGLVITATGGAGGTGLYVYPSDNGSPGSFLTGGPGGPGSSSTGAVVVVDRLANQLCWWWRWRIHYGNPSYVTLHQMKLSSLR